MNNVSIHEAVASKIAGSGETVKNLVIDQLAEVEINNRVELVKKGLAKVTTLKAELKKIDQPDGVSYAGSDKTGEIKTYSAGRIKEIESAKEKLTKVEKALDKALEDNSKDAYNKLADVVK